MSGTKQLKGSMKKRLMLILLLSVYLVAMTACGVRDDEPIGGDEWGIFFTDVVVTPTGMSLTLQQSGIRLDDELLYGDDSKECVDKTYCIEFDIEQNIS